MVHFHGRQGDQVYGICSKCCRAQWVKDADYKLFNLEFLAAYWEERAHLAERMRDDLSEGIDRALGYDDDEVENPDEESDLYLDELDEDQDIYGWSIDKTKSGGLTLTYTLSDEDWPFAHIPARDCDMYTESYFRDGKMALIFAPWGDVRKGNGVMAHVSTRITLNELNEIMATLVESHACAER
jgi:hypothetical protein